MDVRDNQLSLGGCSAVALADAFGTPLYVYEEDVIRRQCRAMREAFAAAQPDLHYAVKANFNPAILRILRDEGLGIDAVSSFEVRLCLELGFKPEQILFTGNNTSEGDFEYCLAQGVPINVGSLVELERYGRLNPGGRVSLRINPDVGAGHHPHVITGGPHSKFGIYHSEQPAIRVLLEQHGLQLVGIQSHIGTGILRTDEMLQAMEIILNTARGFQALEFVDFGGGFGIPYRPDQKPLPLKELGSAMCERFASFCSEYGRPLKMKLEPGRYLVAQSAALLVRVTNIQSTPAHTFVGTDSGFNHLVRPAMYGAYHEVVNASRVTGGPSEAVVAGNLCDAGDIFTQNKDGWEHRAFTRPAVGDVLAVLDAGAYGMVLASNYNLRPRPAEVLVHAGNSRLIRRRESYDDLVQCFVRATD
jgi:diaminopimelate decarboxylase